jgi:spore coat protein CotH
MRKFLIQLGASSVAVCVPFLTVGQAQPPGDQPAPVQLEQMPRRGPIGLGMGGPMMVMMAGGGISILEMQEVQKELAIRDDQKPRIQESLQAERDRVRTSMQEFDPAQVFSLPPLEQQAKLAEMAKKVEAGIEDSVKQVGEFLDEQQVTRLRELMLQRDGLRAFDRAWVAEKLALTDKQKIKLKQLLAQSNPLGGFGPGGGGPGGFGGPSDGSGGGVAPGGGPGFGGPGFGGPPNPADLQKITEISFNEFLKGLTDEQRGKWERMKGKPFQFPQQNFSFGPPGMGVTVKLVSKFDKNDDGWLNREERDAARPEAKSGAGQGMFGGPGGRRGGGGPGGPGGGRGPGGFGGGPGGGGPGGGGPGGGGPGGGGPGGFGGGPGGFGGGPGGFGGGPGGGPFGGEREPATPGIQIVKDEAPLFADESLYDTNVLRTIFIDFEKDDWESELADFKPTDVEVDASMTVDGKTYPTVGVSFRGSSSYFSIGQGHKRSINISMDMADSEQRLLNYKTLNLLNSNDDASMMHAVLYSHISSKYTPTPKANFVRVVINGENWGIYQNVQQFNNDLIEEWYPNKKGARWKVPGRPGGGGSLAYLGDNIEDYKRLYEIKSKDREEDWQALVELCRVLNETPAEKLQSALEPILDVESVLWFLAIDNVLINSDGYWIRASDYSLHRDSDGKFHIIAHDMNESFQPAMGPGMGGMGPGGGMRQSGRPGQQQRPRGDDNQQAQRDDQGARPGRNAEGGGRPGNPGNQGMAGPAAVAIDPLVGADDASKPLRHRLLAVPELRESYLEKVRTLAEKELDWNNLGPVVEQYGKLIAGEVDKDTRKLSSFAAFKAAVSEEEQPATEGRGRPRMSLKSFAEQRRKFLLEHPAIQALPKK